MRISLLSRIFNVFFRIFALKNVRATDSIFSSGTSNLSKWPIAMCSCPSVKQCCEYHPTCALYLWGPYPLRIRVAALVLAPLGSGAAGDGVCEALQHPRCSHLAWSRVRVVFARQSLIVQWRHMRSLAAKRGRRRRQKFTSGTKNGARVRVE